MQHYAVYGVTLATDFSFRWPIPKGRAPADLTFECRTDRPLPVPWSSALAVHEVDTGGDRPPGISYHRFDGADGVRVRGVADHLVEDDRIVCYLHEPRFAYLVEIQLLGMVLALWLERRGIPVLHASSAVVGGRAVAFLGQKGGGKTTLAAALVRAGHPLLADDLLAIDRAAGSGARGDTASAPTPFARPGYPMLRLWPDQARHFAEEVEPGPLVHPAYDKRVVPLSGGGSTGPFGRFHEEKAPLGRIYLPARTPEGEADSVSLEALPPVRSVVELVRHAYLREAVEGLGLAADRLPALAALCRDREVRVLRYPGGFRHLSEVVRRVEADIAEDGAHGVSGSQ